MTKHGIRIEEKATKKLVDFIECSTGREALQILSGVRINLGNDYRATEGFLKDGEQVLIRQCLGDIELYERNGED